MLPYTLLHHLLFSGPFEALILGVGGEMKNSFCRSPVSGQPRQIFGGGGGYRGRCAIKLFTGRASAGEPAIIGEIQPGEGNVS
ncbi:MAG: hypothetical protein PHD36_05390 [Desulfotomaculaceae bacterium]|nr:hypothetical protein [Desulfotomaculaceae bacterium]